VTVIANYVFLLPLPVTCIHVHVLLIKGWEKRRLVLHSELIDGSHPGLLNKDGLFQLNCVMSCGALFLVLTRAHPPLVLVLSWSRVRWSWLHTSYDIWNKGNINSQWRKQMYIYIYSFSWRILSRATYNCYTWQRLHASGATRG